jgi:hypothetical protein
MANTLLNQFRYMNKKRHAHRIEIGPHVFVRFSQ